MYLTIGNGALVSCDGGSHKDTCWEDNFTGSVLSWMCPPAGFPGSGRMHRWPCPAGIPGSNQLGLALKIECGALHCLLIDMQRDPQQLLRSILSLVAGCPLSCGLCLSRALSCNTPGFYRNLGTADVYNPAGSGCLRRL